MSFMKHKDHMMKSTLMAPKWTRKWGQRWSSTAISRMVWQPAANCPKDFQTTAPSLQLRLQPSVWHWNITNTWAQSIMMWYFICHIMNLLWSLSDKGTRVPFCWVPSHCGIDGNERVDQLAKETLDQDIDPLYRYETTSQLLHSEVGSNQVGCSCTWQRSLSCETNTGATEEVPAPNQSCWRGCNHPVLNWPYQGHEIPYLVPRTANWLSPLWSNTDHWPYAAGVCIVTGMSWWILHSRLVECSLWDNSWDLHSRVPARSGILLSNMI